MGTGKNWELVMTASLYCDASKQPEAVVDDVGIPISATRGLSPARKGLPVSYNKISSGSCDKQVSMRSVHCQKL